MKVPFERSNHALASTAPTLVLRPMAQYHTPLQLAALFACAGIFLGPLIACSTSSKSAASDSGSAVPACDQTAESLHACDEAGTTCLTTCVDDVQSACYCAASADAGLIWICTPTEHVCH